MFLKTEPAFYAAVLVAMTHTAIIVSVKIHSHSHYPPYFSGVGFGA